ncbi:DNA helicase RecG, partial [Clostridium botulinum C/D]|nr:DNA helicase RecG [Clostridium botulinum C/D]
MNINDDVASLKGIGPKTKELLNKCGIYKILDLLLYFPRDYEKIHYCNDISNLKDEDKVIIKAKVKEIKKDIYVKRNMVISTVIFTKNDLEFQGKWFNQKYIKNKFKVNEEYIISGKVKMDKYKVSIINPNILEDTEKLIGITPKYSLKGSLTNNFFNKTINYILSNITIVENIPKNILDKYNLVSLDKSIRNIHHPTREEELLYAMKRLK